jgi:hypothetical protein
MLAGGFTRAVEWVRPSSRARKPLHDVGHARDCNQEGTGNQVNCTSPDWLIVALALFLMDGWIAGNEVRKRPARYSIPGFAVNPVQFGAINGFLGVFRSRQAVRCVPLGEVAEVKRLLLWGNTRSIPRLPEVKGCRID